MYPDEHFVEKPVKEAMAKFRKNLDEIVNAITERNKNKKLPYYYLSPDRIPNSVAVWAETHESSEACKANEAFLLRMFLINELSEVDKIRNLPSPSELTCSLFGLSKQVWWWLILESLVENPLGQLCYKFIFPRFF